jgi:hypothetical protein
MTVHPGLTCKAHTLSRGPSYREVPLLRNGGTARPARFSSTCEANRVTQIRLSLSSLSRISDYEGGRGEMVSARMPTGMIALSSNLVGAPCFSRGSWTSGQRKSNSFRRTGFSPGFFEASAKALIEIQLFCATLEVSWTGSFVGLCVRRDWYFDQAACGKYQSRLTHKPHARLKTQPPRQGYAA